MEREHVERKSNVHRDPEREAKGNRANRRKRATGDGSKIALGQQTG